MPDFMPDFWEPGFDMAAEVTLAVLGGALNPDWQCMYCGLPLVVAANDGWSHQVCDQVVTADWEQHYVHDNGTRAGRRLRRQGKCSWVIRYPGFDGGGIYCGRGVRETASDVPGVYCAEHQADAYGDEEGAAKERCTRTRELLEETFGEHGRPAAG